MSQIADVVCQVETPCVDDRFHKEQVDLMNKLANAANSFETKQLECRYVQPQSNILLRNIWLKGENKRQNNV